MEQNERSQKFINTGRWNKDEHSRFIRALEEYGKNWKEIEKHVGTRTTAQIRSHAQKYFLKEQKKHKPAQTKLYTLATSKKIEDYVKTLRVLHNQAYYNALNQNQLYFQQYSSQVVIPQFINQFPNNTNN